MFHYVFIIIPIPFHWISFDQLLNVLKNTDWLTWIRTQYFSVRGLWLFVWAMVRMEPKYKKKTQFQCHIVHYNSLMEWPPIERRPSQSDIEL